MPEYRSQNSGHQHECVQPQLQVACGLSSHSSGVTAGCKLWKEKGEDQGQVSGKKGRIQGFP